MTTADTQALLADLAARLGPDRVIVDPAQLITYEVDGSFERGHPDGVVFPRSVNEVVELVRWAAEQRVPLIARGSGTGLAGGAVPEIGGVVVQLGLMNRVLELDLIGRSAVVEAGVVNLLFDNQVRKHGLFFPPDPSSQRTATIGGNIGTNAGGPHCFKYGVTSNYVTGLEVVLSDGRIIHTGGRAFDIPAYDLTALFVGSEGTLGIITRADLRVLRDPLAVRTMLAAFDSVERAGEAVSTIIARGLIPATMEMMDSSIVRIVEEYAHPGLPLDAGAVLIIEVDGYPESVGPQIAEIEAILRECSVREMRVAQSAAERDRIWFARKSAAGAMARLAPAYYLVDGTVPRSKLAETLATINQIIEADGFRTGHVFHAGDGNLHPLVLIDDPSDRTLIARVLETGRKILAACVAAGGSITGEHGVGIEKRAFMSLMYGATELSLMWDVKEMFDPVEIMNTGKVLPPRDEIVAPAHHGRPPGAAPVTLQAETTTMSSAGLPIATPTSPEEAADTLRAFIEGGKSVRIRGGGTKSALLPPADVMLSTEDLSGICDLAVEDLYVTVGAGTRLADLQALLQGHGMWAPLASPWQAATIGGIIAANANAPLRMRYGSVRDVLLAATIALPDGRVARIGRPVVKNVAGYDLHKVQVGAYGTLGLLCEVTLKLAPLPRARATVIAMPRRIAQALDVGATLTQQSLIASAALALEIADGGGWLPPLPVALDRRPTTLLVYTAEGLAEDVRAEIAAVRTVLRSADIPALQIDSSGSDLWGAFLSAAQPDDLLIRIGIAPKDIRGFMQRAGFGGRESYLTDLAAGQVYVRAPAPHPDDAHRILDRLRTAARTLNGYAVVLAAPARARLDPWGYTPDALDRMREMRRRWGADGLLNPGAFIV
ncbi:FAD-binding oxidoreductase [Roseiflexus sp.]|uniref:FAD-binding oxidoreductase n=1 Tax=Roseiflexus sp. TaxID=2562120 RepID=UPI0021DD5CD5|nr:FAD-binding oxidoreductase [Roseiflexus sp.]GIW02568.1 MAG: lactate dehydrogenase [Roseiflexus sp.]